MLIKIRSRLFPLNPEILNAVVVLFILIVNNQTMFSRAAKLSSLNSTLIFLAVMAFGLTLAIVTLFSYFGWVWLQKIGLVTLLILSAVTAHYTDTLGAIFDEEMVNNIISTHPSEGAALVNFSMLLAAMLYGVLPAIFVLICPVKKRGWLRNTAVWIITIILSLGLFSAGKALGYKDFVQVSRGEMNSVTYALQPSAFLVASISLLKDRWKVWGVPFTQIGLDAVRGSSSRNASKPVVLFLVVGETARSENHELDGYSRQTNPLLSNLDIVNLGPSTACATSTIPALRCLFSKFSKDEINYVKFATHENLLDVAAHAGISVEWYDNDWTFAEGGVTNRIKVDRLYSRTDLDACSSGECDDAVFFDVFDKVIAETSQSKLVVIHLVGSHFPYYRRYPAEFEIFKPACNSPVLSTCTPDEIVNAYDNSIRYTDFVLSKFIEKLKNQNKIASALLYTSDHGESLGEGGVYLHSAPIAAAPHQQTSVPFFVWMSPSYRTALDIGIDCLKKKAGAGVSHDNFFHTALGLLDVKTAERDSKLDLTDGCK